MSDWRNTYFQKLNCEGMVEKTPSGDFLVQGRLKNHDADAKIMFWAAAPSGYRTSFTGSGLPYPNPEVAFENSPNRGIVRANNSEFSFKVYSPNSYYTGLGTVYMPPHIFFKVCDTRKSDTVHTIKLGEGVPYRMLSYPNVAKGARSNPLFYDGRDQQPVRSQEQILRDSGYPLKNEMAKDFWGLAVPHP